MKTYTLKIIEIVREVENTVTLKFKQPALRKVKYEAGQYLTLIFRINGRRYIRPYSFSSAPTVDSYLEITIKRIENGIVSNHIHDQVGLGDSVEVMEPMGDFTFDNTNNIRSVYFWGVGSGITPLISIIKTILYTSPSISVNLIYGNRKAESVIFRAVINNLLIKFPDKFRVWYFYTIPTINEINSFVIQGRINTEYALNILRKEGVSDSSHYICGPTGLKESVKEALSILNVPASNIFSEDFELIKNPEDYESIHTQNIKIKFLGEDYPLEIIKGKSILEAALDAGLELPYSCQTGNCSTCKATNVSGKVAMIGLVKERNDLKEGECLLCCSHPLTENVCVEII
jgi:ring-1,2-phenylacetyl-CoA epoxidase subunit PaaE